MFLIRLVFIIGALFFAVTVISLLALAIGVRRNLKDMFLHREGGMRHPPGGGDIIEGEYKVLEEKEKR